jgi:hypothetical protein
MLNNNDSLKKYKDLEGVSINKLNAGLWYVENRLLLIKILKYSLIAISFFSWSYFFYGFGYYIFFGMKADDRIILDIARSNIISHEAIAQKGARDLIVDNPIILRQNGKNDIFSKIQNPNDRFFVKFDFVFKVGGEEIKRDRSFVLPAEQSFAIALSQEVDSGNDPEIYIENIEWKRLNAHVIPDWPGYKFSHLNFEVTDTSIIKADDFNKPENKSINFAEVKFSIKNNSPFNYQSPEFIIILRNGFGISGINKYVINRFKSGEKRDVSINWPDAPSDASNIEVIPNINIIDADIYFKFD